MQTEVATTQIGHNAATTEKNMYMYVRARPRRHGVLSDVYILGWSIIPGELDRRRETEPQIKTIRRFEPRSQMPEEAGCTEYNIHQPPYGADFEWTKCLSGEAQHSSSPDRNFLFLHLVSGHLKSGGWARKAPPFI